MATENWENDFDFGEEDGEELGEEDFDEEMEEIDEDELYEGLKEMGMPGTIPEEQKGAFC